MCFSWETNKLLHCPYISKKMSRDRFENITRCLHLVDLTKIMIDKATPRYDKLAKM